MEVIVAVFVVALVVSSWTALYTFNRMQQAMLEWMKLVDERLSALEDQDEDLG